VNEIDIPPGGSVAALTSCETWKSQAFLLNEDDIPAGGSVAASTIRHLWNMKITGICSEREWYTSGGLSCSLDNL
jgi:hypothetical protein